MLDYLEYWGFQRPPFAFPDPQTDLQLSDGPIDKRADRASIRTAQFRKLGTNLLPQ